MIRRPGRQGLKVVSLIRDVAIRNVDARHAFDFAPNPDLRAEYDEEEARLADEALRPKRWWDGLYARRVRLTQPYERDMELWVAQGADPKWVTLPVGEEFDCSDDEADDLIRKGIAAEVEK